MPEDSHPYHDRKWVLFELYIREVRERFDVLETRTKTSIRYAKEYDREKRERRRERERKVEGEIYRERER